MAEGNRKDPRARVLNMTVRYKSATVDEFIENHSHDISRGGIFIKTRAPFPAGTLLKFEVRIAEDQRLMQGVGRVVWRREPERAEEGFPAGMGIKFIKTGEGAAELIAQIISAREGEETSSFDAGARGTGLEDGAASEPGARRSAAPTGVVAASDPPADSPALQVESGPLSMPVEGELRVSSPPKKRQGQVSETRKVVLQGAAFGAANSEKTPVSTPARVVAAQALDERAPSREAPPAKERSSIVDETTAPRARSSGDLHGAGSKEARAKEERQSGNPSVYGLVAILGAIGLTVFLVTRIRGPEEEAPPPAASTTSVAAPTANVAPPPAPLPTPPTTPVPAAESGEGALPADVGATAARPSTSLGIATGTGAAPGTAAGTAASGAVGAKTPQAIVPGTASGAPTTAAPAGAPAAAVPAATLPAAGAKVVPAPVAAKPAAPSAPAAAPKPKPAAAAAATAKPAAAPKPKPDAPPADGEASIRPAGEPEPAPPAGANAPAASAGAKPAEAPKKSPPAAATPTEPEPAPSPKPSDDNPY